MEGFVLPAEKAHLLQGRRAVRPSMAAALILAVAVAGACSGASVAGDESGLEPVVGNWRGVLLSAGGELPFGFRVDAEGAVPPGSVVNAGALEPFTQVVRQGAASYTMSFFPPGAAIESELVAKLAPDGETVHGFWRFTPAAAAGDPPPRPGIQMPFTATKNDTRRFQRNDPTLDVATPAAAAALLDLSGEWQVVVTGEDGPVASVVSLRQSDEHVVAAPVDGSAAGQMEGIYRDGLLRLSRFDGLRAVMVHARATTDGGLAGTLWRQQNPGVSWSARRR